MAQSAEWKDIESLELYVKPKTVSTRFDSAYQPDELGTEFARDGSIWMTSLKENML